MNKRPKGNNGGNGLFYGAWLGIFALLFAAWVFRQQNPDYREPESYSGLSSAPDLVADDRSPSRRD